MTTQLLCASGLDDIWRERVCAIKAKYLEAKTGLDRAVVDCLNGTTDAKILRIAGGRHDRCLREYMYALRVFTDLVLDGKLPPKKA